MNTTQLKTIDQRSEESPARCQHRTLKGRCRQLATDSAGTLCFHHARAQRQAKDDFTLLEPLVRKLEDLQSVEGISEDLAASFDLEGRSRMDGDPRYSLGLMIKSIDEFVDNPESDPNRLRLLRDLRTHFVPFARDYIKYVSTVTPQEDATFGQYIGVAHAQLLEQARRTLDISEEQRDGSHW